MAPEAIATNPAASPSSPSMKFTALVIPITHSAVSSGVTELDRTIRPANGSLNQNIVTPRKTSTIAART